MKTITDHIVDILQNSTRGGASEISLQVDTVESPGFLVFTISDDGTGIPADMMDSISDPFTTTRKTRKVGLGIPLLKQHARQAGGEVDIRSSHDSGTTVTASFQLDNIDRQPLGDMGEAVALFITGNPEVNLKFRFTSSNGTFEVSTAGIVESLGFEDFTRPEWFAPIRDMIRENLEDIGAAAL